jgi:exo-1,4-beta-D-glucosaminidase
VVVNSYIKTFRSYRVTAEVLNLDMARKFSRHATLDIPPDSSNRVFTLPDLQGLSRTYFIRLLLQAPAGNVVSRNFYWLSTHPDVFNWDASTWYFTPLQSFADFKDLQQLPTVKLEMSARGEDRGQAGMEQVTLKNGSSHLAFFVHLEVLRGKGGQAVHPILWQDNDFELIPGEEREITGSYRSADLSGAKPVVAVSGWNVLPAATPE